MPRFYHSAPLPVSGSIELPYGAAHHAVRVLRLQVGETLQLFDGSGNECQGTILDISGKRVVVGNIISINASCESPLQTVLAQALLSSEKMDWVVQKATELGVGEMQPLATERSVAKLSGERADKRVEHWQQVAISACEQCGRNVLPQIHAPLDIMAWLASMQKSSATKFVLLPQGEQLLQQQTRPSGKIVLLIGAEGGFSAAESEAAMHDAGFIPLRLGARVLRAETAAVAALVAGQTLWGDFN
ncbi:MAG TPA: 16S rRNA (uracil(1498)-N(3))-methyltransferase [Gallionella sp.]|nr:16S rRNA (uracil(1498)-N(3))-methyltransferase [Gallionella sp.]